jgi:hypothetical protein
MTPRCEPCYTTLEDHSEHTMPDHPSSATDDRVVSIRTGRRFQSAPGGGPKSAPPSDSDLDQYTRVEEPDDFRHRMTVNAIAFVFVVALIAAGVWLADTLATMRKNQDCVLSGKRGCTPAEILAPAR